MTFHIHTIVENADNQKLTLLDHINYEVSAMMMNTNRWGKFGSFTSN